MHDLTANDRYTHNIFNNIHTHNTTTIYVRLLISARPGELLFITSAAGPNEFLVVIKILFKLNKPERGVLFLTNDKFMTSQQ